MRHLDVLRKLALARRGFAPLAILPVALPMWRLRLRVEVLAHQDVSPLERFVLRAADEVDPRLGSIQRLLGLDEETFDNAISAVVVNDWARVTEQASLKLTEPGRVVAATARRARSEERVITVEYDGLTREPVLTGQTWTPAQSRRLGLRELPSEPAGPPDVVELVDGIAALQEIIRRIGDGRDQEIDLLAVRGILRRDRIFRQADLIVFRSLEGVIQTLPVIDGVSSPTHEQALSKPAVVRQLRLATELQRGRRFEQLLPQYLRDLYDADAQARANQVQAEQDAREDDDPGAVGTAADTLRTLLVRHVAPFEHPQLLMVAVRTATSRLLIVSPDLSASALDRELLRALRDRLEAGVNIRIAFRHEPGRDIPTALQKLSVDFPGLALVALRKAPVSVLVRDDDLAVKTLFPLLAWRGLTRSFRDERGWLVNGAARVRPFAKELEHEVAVHAVPDTDDSRST